MKKSATWWPFRVNDFILYNFTDWSSFLVTISKCFLCFIVEVTKTSRHYWYLVCICHYICMDWWHIIALWWWFCPCRVGGAVWNHTAWLFPLMPLPTLSLFYSYFLGGGWGCEVSCGGHHRPRGKTTTGSALDGAVFDIAQILAYLVHNMSRSQLYLGFGHFGWLPSFFGQ